MAWIDYKKAYDMIVPYGVAENITSLLENSMEVAITIIITIIIIIIIIIIIS